MQIKHMAMHPAHVTPFLRSEHELLAMVASGRACGDDCPHGAAVPFISGNTAVFTLTGPMLDSVPDYYYWCGIDAVDMGVVARQLAEVYGNPSIEMVELRIDSPGGTVAGTEALASVIMAGATRTVAVISNLCASAAYWIASACDEIVTMTMTAEIGCIGVYSVIYDRSKSAENEGVAVHLVSSGGVKGGTVAGIEISDEVLADTERVVVGIAEIFTAAVAENRGIENAKELSTGQVWLAKEALSLGLIDELQARQDGPAARSETRELTEANNMLDAKQIAALVQANAAHAPLITTMAADGKDHDSILAAIGHQSHLAEVAELTKRAAEAEAKVESVSAELATLTATHAELTEKHDALAALKSGASEDPGPGAAGEAKSITREAFGAMSGKDRANYMSSGGKLTDEKGE